MVDVVDDGAVLLVELDVGQRRAVEGSYGGDGDEGLVLEQGDEFADAVSEGGSRYVAFWEVFVVYVNAVEVVFFYYGF